MLVEILNEMIDMYFQRSYSRTIYCGMGTTLDRLWAESGVSRWMWNRLDALAYARAMALRDEEDN